VKHRSYFLALFALAACASAATAASAQPAARQLLLAGLEPGGVPEAEATARAFAAALKNGDRDAVLALLSAQAQINEGGHTQTRSEYAAAHLAADIAFLRKVRIDPVSFGSKASGDSALVGSETEVHTTSSKGRQVTLRNRELLRLQREGGAWKIVTVRWESAPLESTGK